MAGARGAEAVRAAGIALALAATAFAVAAAALPRGGGAVEVKASKRGFEPSQITLRRGDTVSIALSSVDTETEERILDGVLTAHPERTVLFVSHRLSTMRRADRILVFEDGALVETGTHEALMAGGGPYRRLIDQQLLAEELEREDL